jgi:hypothetical protein
MEEWGQSRSLRPWQRCSGSRDKDPRRLPSPARVFAVVRFSTGTGRKDKEKDG